VHSNLRDVQDISDSACIISVKDTTEGSECTDSDGRPHGSDLAFGPFEGHRHCDVWIGSRSLIDLWEMEAKVEKRK
jgi:hypothetical protein